MRYKKIVVKNLLFQIEDQISETKVFSGLWIFQHIMYVLFILKY